MATKSVHGQASWEISNRSVRAFVTELGGMIGPVEFSLGGRVVSPLAVAPWAEEPDVSGPPVIHALRGDFFCMPFGSNPGQFMGEEHPLHGESANGTWLLESQVKDSLTCLIQCSARPSRVSKTVALGDNCVYQRHTVTGLRGPMTFGNHLMVFFKSPGVLSLSPQRFGQVFPGPFEEPSQGGYSSLKVGAMFDRLESVATANGGSTDLTMFPAREGFEDLVMVSSDEDTWPAWSAIWFPEENYVLFQLKHAKVLVSTVLWFSNGGRHYAPWNGRHRHVLGIEEATSYFHLGLRGSTAPNDANAAGVPTFRDFHDGRPFSIGTVFGVVEVPPGFGKVDRIVPGPLGIAVFGASGRVVEANVDLSWLAN